MFRRILIPSIEQRMNLNLSIVLFAFLPFLTRAAIFPSQNCFRKTSSFLFAPCSICFEGYKLIEGKCQPCRLGDLNPGCKIKKQMYYGASKGVSLATQSEEQLSHESVNVDDEALNEMIQKIKKQTTDKRIINNFIEECKQFMADQGTHFCEKFDESGCTSCQQGYQLVINKNMEESIKVRSDLKQLSKKQNLFVNKCRKIETIDVQTKIVENKKQHESGMKESVMQSEIMQENQKNQCEIYSDKQQKCKLCFPLYHLSEAGKCLQSTDLPIQQKTDPNNQQHVLYSLKDPSNSVQLELDNLSQKKPGFLSIEKITLVPETGEESITLKLPIKKGENGEKKALNIYVIEEKYLKDEIKAEKQVIDKSEQNNKTQSEDEPIDDSIFIFMEEKQSQKVEQIKQSSTNTSTDLQLSLTSQAIQSKKIDPSSVLSKTENSLGKNDIKLYNNFFSRKSTDGCLKYSLEQPKRCERCQFLFRLAESGQCIKVDPFCKNYDKESDKCIECLDGFTLQNTRCSKIK